MRILSPVFKLSGAAIASLSVATFLALSVTAVGCVASTKNVDIPPADAGLTLPDAAPAVLPLVDASIPILDAGPDGSSFATGLGAGAVVTKSAKYTLITKTGGSPGGHGVSASPNHTILSGAAANTKK